MKDMVNNPPHYTGHPSGVECIDVAEHFDFCLGNALKYIWRCDHKGKKLEDLEKAKFYIERAIERERKCLHGSHNHACGIDDGNALLAGEQGPGAATESMIEASALQKAETLDAVYRMHHPCLQISETSTPD